MTADRTVRDTERLLPLLQALSFVALAVLVVQAASNLRETDSPAGTVFCVLVIAAWAVIGVAWIIRARTRSPRLRAGLAIAVVAGSVPLTLYGTFGLAYAVLLLALALLVLDVSRRAGAIGWAVCALVPPIALLLIGGSVGSIVLSGVGLGALEGVGFALGVLLRGLEERSAEDRRLIAERDDAVARAQEAMVRLRRAAETEKELMLADERTRAARDLHDGLGHRLTLITMSLEFAERMRERDADAAWSEVATARDTATEALGEMRTWVRALSPVRESGVTGIAAFDAIAESFRGTGLDVSVRRGAGAAAAEVDEDVSLLLYRAVQEGLTNALRHGRASTVRIDVETVDGAIDLAMVSDLDPETRDRVPLGPLRYGFGLRSLSERAADLGGRVDAAREGDVVVLRVRVPTAGSAEIVPRAAGAGGRS